MSGGPAPGTGRGSVPRDCPPDSLRESLGRLNLGEPQDDVAVRLAGHAYGVELVDPRLLKPDQALAVRVELWLDTRAAERERAGERLEGGLGDGDADHAADLGDRPR